MVMKAGDFLPYLTRVAEDLELALKAAFDELSTGRSPSRLVDAMRYAALGGGKRLRPFLLVEAARLFGAGGEGVMRAGAAVECLHVYSLVHDDLPAMDDDELRRGKPTVHRAFDEATAILVGDTLQTLAFELLADPRTHKDAAVRSELVLCLARAAGAVGMAGGQMLDLAAEGRFHGGGRIRLDIASIRELQAMKTGALLAAAVEMGAIIGGADANARQTLRRYGEFLGAAFQIADDILDVEASAAAMGKATGKDAERGKGTLVDHLGLSAAREERDRLAGEAAACLSIFGDDAIILRSAARFSAERRS
jgi:farnesyl diphosphate synthase